jgi:hypothetical protein
MLDMSADLAGWMMTALVAAALLAIIAAAHRRWR